VEFALERTRLASPQERIAIVSQPSLSPPGPILGSGRKPKTSIYILLLIVALVALLIGCILLLLEVKRNGGFGTVRGRISAVLPAESGTFAHVASLPSIA
jgi:hypothetical protein